MDKAQLPLSMEVLATTLNISSEEFSTLFEEKDGVKTPKDDNTVSNFLKRKLGERIESVLSEKESEIEKAAEGKWKRLAYKEIEDKAKDEFGISMEWSKDGLSKIKEQLSKAKGKEPIDVEKSEQFIKMVQDYEAKLKQVTEESSNTLNEYKTKTTKSSLENDLFLMFKEQSDKLAIPHDDNVLRKQVRNIINLELFQEDLRPAKIDDKWTIVDKDGKVAKDKSNAYQDYDFNSHVLNIAKTGYFPELKTPKITSPHPAKEGNPFEVNHNGNKQTYHIPTFKTLEELMVFTKNLESEKAPIEVMREANKQLQNFE